MKAIEEILILAEFLRKWGYDTRDLTINEAVEIKRAIKESINKTVKR